MARKPAIWVAKNNKNWAADTWVNEALSDSYIKIVPGHFFDNMEDLRVKTAGIIFQQGNDSKHTAESTTK